VLTATRRPQAADREPGGFACKLVLKPRSRSGRCIGPVQTLAGARVCGTAGAPPAPQMWRCPEPAQRIPDVRSISPPQHRAHAATGRSPVAACARAGPQTRAQTRPRVRTGTSAGVTAGVDVCLHLIRTDHGAAAE